MTTSTSEDLIRTEAAALGFDICRFTDLDATWPAAGRLAEFVDAGRHRQMSWMADTVERGAQHCAMWAGARSAVMLGMNYGPDPDPRAVLALRDRGAMSVYAQGDDYHGVIKARLKALARWLQGQRLQPRLDHLV